MDSVGQAGDLGLEYEREGADLIGGASLLIAPDRAGRVLEPGQTLFKQGDRKTTAYRIETGAVCLFTTRANGERKVVGFAFQGEIVGLGALDTHAFSAETESLCLLSPVARPNPGDSDVDMAEKHARATEQEMQVLREQLVDRGRRNNLERVAALLVALSRLNTYEGREQSVVIDAISCGEVADQLGFGIDELGKTLVALARLDMVESTPSGGLRLRDLRALERLADGV